MLALEDVHSGYGPIEVLKGISLTVNEGEIVTLIGANGAGKTTTLHCISALHPIKKGKITFQGQELRAIPAHRLVELGMAQVPEGRKVFPRQTVLENLELGAFSRKDRGTMTADMEKIFSLFPILKERTTQLAGTLSGGEQQMLVIGRALMSKPKLLLLDEPSMGVAPLLVQRIFETIKRLNDEGMTILLVEQNAHLALQLAKRAYVMETGKIVLEGKGSDLLNDPRIREAYLGE